METLRFGSSGRWVRSLQLWLANFGPIEVDGYFGAKTRKAVHQAQRHFGLKEDGIVGPQSAGRFLIEGWLPPGFDQPGSPDSAYPEKPDDFRPLSPSQKLRKWGSPGSPPRQPQPGGPIQLDPIFFRNIVRLDLRQWFPHLSEIWQVDVHHKVEQQWRSLFDSILARDLGHLMLSCAGSWNPRFVRGSTSTFSAHAFATAIDFNASQNWLGAQPAKKNKPGSLVEIIPIAAKLRIWWGGWFTRVDGMHFESTATDAELGW